LYEHSIARGAVCFTWLSNSFNVFSLLLKMLMRTRSEQLERKEVICSYRSPDTLKREHCSWELPSTELRSITSHRVWPQPKYKMLTFNFISNLDNCPEKN